MTEKEAIRKLQKLILTFLRRDAARAQEVTDLFCAIEKMNLKPDKRSKKK